MAVLKSPKNNKNKKLWIHSKSYKSKNALRKFNYFYIGSGHDNNPSWRSPKNALNKQTIKKNLKTLYGEYIST